MDTYIYNTICSQILETTKMPIDNRMDKTWYIHAINEHFTTTCNNMDLKNNVESKQKSTRYAIPFITAQRQAKLTSGSQNSSYTGGGCG